MNKKTSRLRSLLKSITLAAGLTASPIQGVQAQNTPRDDNNDPAKEWIMKQYAEISKKNDEYMNRYEEKLAKSDTLELSPEDFVTKLQAINEQEETQDFTRAQAYNEITARFGHDINDRTAEFITQSISMGKISMDSIAPEHYALLTSPSAIQNLDEEQRKDLSERFINYFNQNPDKVPDKDIALVLNSPIGRSVLEGENHLNFGIDTAERLLADNSVDLANIAKTQNGFRAYALDNTFADLNKRIASAAGKEKTKLELEAVDCAYKYAQNDEIVGEMKNSSIMGSYALDKVFDGHMHNENFVSNEDIDVIRNIFADVLKNQNDRIALGNYNRINLEYGKLMPEAYSLQDQLNYLETNGKIREHNALKSNYWSSANGVLREFLGNEIAEVNKKIIQGTTLDKEGDLLYRSLAFYNKSEAYQQYSDFSKAYQVISRYNDGFNLTDSNFKLDKEKLSKISQYEINGNIYSCNSRQIDFGMYIYYRELTANNKKAKLTEEQREEFNKIVELYTPDHLERMYNITAAVHNRDFSKAIKASKDIKREEGIYINVEARVGQKGLKKTVDTNKYREDIETKAFACNFFQEEWDKVARQGGQIYQEENQNAGGASSIEDIIRHQKATKGTHTAKAEPHHTSDVVASYIAEIRAKSNASTRTKSIKSDNKAAISLAIRNYSQKTMG